MKKLMLLFICSLLWIGTGVHVYAESEMQRTAEGSSESSTEDDTDVEADNTTDSEVENSPENEQPEDETEDVIQDGVEVTNADGTTQIYEKAVTTFVYNQKTKSLKSTPGIVINHQVMIPYNFVFQSVLGIKVTESSNKKVITLQTREHKMKFTVGSKTAVLDGEKKSLSVAPVRAKYMETGKEVIVIPAKVIADVWGYTYTFNEKSSTVSFTRTGGIELKYAGLALYYKDKTLTLLANGKKVNSNLPGFRVNNRNRLPIGKMIQALGGTYRYSSDKKQITISYDSQTVVMTLDSKVAKINGKTVTMKTAPIYIRNKETGIGCNMISEQFFTEYLGVTVKWDKNKSTVNVISSKEKLSGYQVVIPLPEGYKRGNYTVNDNYHNYQFEITLTGNYKSFYNKNKIKNKTNSIKSISVKQISSKKTQIILKSNTIKGYKIRELNGNLYVKVAKPKEIYDKIVVLDAGHGGTDSGAIGNGLYEKTCNLNIVKAAKKYLDKDGSIKVYYTRIGNTQAKLTSGSYGMNTSTSLRARTKFANTVEADLFISVHINSSPSKSARGTEVYYSTKNNRKSSGGLTSAKLAQYAYNDMVKAVGSLKRGVKTANFYVNRYTTMPSILIEVGFISNKQDANILKSSKKIDQMGRAIYNSVKTAFSKHSTGR